MPAFPSEPPHIYRHPGLGPRTCWYKQQLLLDALLAAVLTLMFLVALFFRNDSAVIARHPGVFDAVLGAAALLALAVRRRMPVVVLSAVGTVCLVLTAAGYDPALGPAVGYLIAVYTVAAHRGLATSLPAGFTALGVYVAMVVALGADFWQTMSNVIIFVSVWWLGRGLRLRRAYLDELESRARRLERARDADSRAARAEERSRIARELHDVVAHHVSVMTVQAGAARRILNRDPEAVQDALTTIEQTGRTALGEMRRLVGVLRTSTEPRRGELSPQPGVHEVDRLVEQLRDTGLTVDLRVEGERRSLSPGVDLAAYRLIQEALTNTLKHAGSQARAWVCVRYGDGQLAVEVADDGRGLTAGPRQPDDAGGHGLVGMRERVALYGGDLRIGPRSGGGFQVRARFPLEVR